MYERKYFNSVTFFVIDSGKLSTVIRMDTGPLASLSIDWI